MVFLGSGKVSISVRSNLVFKDFVNRSLAKRSKRIALKRARRIVEGYGPWVPLASILPPNAEAKLRAACGASGGLPGCASNGDTEK